MSKSEVPIAEQLSAFVRRLDNVLNDVHRLALDGDELAKYHHSMATNNDHAQEMAEVLHGIEKILFHLTNRMARRYAGEDIEYLSPTKLGYASKHDPNNFRKALEFSHRRSTAVVNPTKGKTR